jgi:hypothetical protein
VGVLLSSDDTSAVTVPPMVVVPAGATMAMFDATGVTLAGVATVTATLAASTGTSMLTVVDVMGVPVTTLALSEILYDLPSMDTGLEWIELYNGTGADIDLSGYTLQNGGLTYAVVHTFAAGAMITAGECLLVGPGAGVFSPDLQNSCSATGTCAADGIALVDAGGTMIDAVIYGPPGSNTSMLVDETGAAGEPDVDDAVAGSSIERVGPNAWRIQMTPSMGDCTIIE